MVKVGIKLIIASKYLTVRRMRQRESNAIEREDRIRERVREREKQLREGMYWLVKF